MNNRVALQQTTSWRDDVRVLTQLIRGKRRSGDHAADLDAFYGPQADAYDRFRERLLPGRAEFMRALPLSAGARVIDFGAGTARHWLYEPERAAAFARVDLVDLCAPLLAIARTRLQDQPQFCAHHADATSWRASEPADGVIFSYSLSMMPDWYAVLENARTQVKPGGIIGVIDFYTLAARPPTPLTPLSLWDRLFWPRWFRHDGVMLRPTVVPRLLELAQTRVLTQGHAAVPYLPGLRVPWFMWIGQVGSAA
jgi:SAM-dependent methyltransferase